MLSWIAAVLFADGAVSRRHIRQRFNISLDRLTRRVRNLLIIRAAQLARRREPKRLRYWRRGRDLRRAHFLRSAFGGHLRRTLKHKDIATRIARLIAVLRNLDAYAAQLAKRLRRGLTRLWPRMVEPAFAPLRLGPPAPPPAVADSS